MHLIVAYHYVMNRDREVALHVGKKAGSKSYEQTIFIQNKIPNRQRYTISYKLKLIKDYSRFLILFKMIILHFLKAIYPNHIIGITVLKS